MNKCWRSNAQYYDIVNNTILHTSNLLTDYILKLLSTKKEMTVR